MEALRVVINIIFILVCVALTVLVLMQEGKSAGLGSISGAAETYWGRNKGRSMEGMLVKITKPCSASVSSTPARPLVHT